MGAFHVLPFVCWSDARPGAPRWPSWRGGDGTSLVVGGRTCGGRCRGETNDDARVADFGIAVGGRRAWLGDGSEILGDRLRLLASGVVLLALGCGAEEERSSLPPSEPAAMELQPDISPAEREDLKSRPRRSAARNRQSGCASQRLVRGGGPVARPRPPPHPEDALPAGWRGNVVDAPWVAGRCSARRTEPPEARVSSNATASSSSYRVPAAQ